MSGRGLRTTAALTGRAREVGPIEARERTVLAVASKITRTQQRVRQLQAEEKRLRKALRHYRRELRLLLQTHADVTEKQLETGGQPDGTDRAIALAENRRPS